MQQPIAKQLMNVRDFDQNTITYSSLISGSTVAQYVMQNSHIVALTGVIPVTSPQDKLCCTTEQYVRCASPTAVDIMFEFCANKFISQNAHKLVDLHLVRALVFPDSVIEVSILYIVYCILYGGEK